MTKSQRVIKMASIGYDVYAISPSVNLTPKEVFNILTAYEAEGNILSIRPVIHPEDARPTPPCPYRLLKQRLINFSEGAPHKITVEQALKHFGSNPVCYLTGKRIDLDAPDTYQLDHIIPSSRGGESNLDNLGLLAPIINRIKSNLTPEEVIRVCRRIIQYTEGKPEVGKARKRGGVRHAARLRKQGVPTVRSVKQTDRLAG